VHVLRRGRGGGRGGSVRCTEGLRKAGLPGHRFGSPPCQPLPPSQWARAAPGRGTKARRPPRSRCCRSRSRAGASVSPSAS
jgi:hypothetical protein